MSDGLARKMVAAKKQIQALMKHKTARLLFNAPVELPGCEGWLHLLLACRCKRQPALAPADLLSLLQTQTSSSNPWILAWC